MSLTGVYDLYEASQSEFYHLEWDYPNAPCLFPFSLCNMAPTQTVPYFKIILRKGLYSFLLRILFE